MFENIAAIDIGTSSIKLLTVRTGFKNFQVTSMSYEDIDPNAESPEEGMARALAKILQESPIKGHTVISNLPMEKAILRTISFPFNDPEKIAAAIPFEAEENMPFKIDDLVMDFQSLRSTTAGEGSILLAAIQKEGVREYLKRLNESGLQPVRLGLESNALFECYKYFNQIPDETVLQLDIGNSKTIMNIISRNHFLYTRCMGIGVRDAVQGIAGAFHVSTGEASELFNRLGLDLTSFENNIQKEAYRSLGLNRQRLKKAFEITTAVFEELIEQIVLSMKAFAVDHGTLDFSRMIISGGGAGIQGLGFLLSENIGMPVVAMPFLQGYTEEKVQTHFPIVFGTMLAYIDRKYSSINFLKGEFLPDFVNESRKIYYLAGAFGVFSLIILLINIGVSSYIKIQTNARYTAMLNERFERYFHTRQKTSEPLKSAMKIVNDEKKELNNIDQVIQAGDNVLDLLRDIIALYPSDPSFLLNNLVINENIVRIDGAVSSSKNIDDFKNKLTDSRKFDSVNLNTSINKKNEVTFSLVIKQKITKQPGKSIGGGEAR